MQGKEMWISQKDSHLADELPFLVTASHELKSPLALVRQLALSLEDGQADGPEQAEIVKQILLTSERALRLTTDLSRSARASGRPGSCRGT